jgi:hypothetical protein
LFKIPVSVCPIICVISVAPARLSLSVCFSSSVGQAASSSYHLGLLGKDAVAVSLKSLLMGGHSRQSSSRRSQLAFLVTFSVGDQVEYEAAFAQKERERERERERE